MEDFHSYNQTKMGNCINPNEKNQELSTKPSSINYAALKPAYPSIEDVIHHERLKAKR